MASVGHTIDEISEQLRQEEEWLNTLTGSLERSEQLKQNMLDILDSFSQRLSNLQATVLPLYEHTGLLQQRQMNISKTLKVIDSTLSHYTAVAELDAILRNAEPSDDVDKFLKHMMKLKDAIKYFFDEKASSSHLENAKSTFEFGCSSLEREFKETLRKNSLLPKVDVILSTITEDYDVEFEKLESVDLIPVKDVETLSKIAQWLVLHGTSTDFTSFYSEHRSLQIQKCLKNIFDHLKSLTPVSLRTQASPVPSRRDTAFLRSQGAGAIRKLSKQYTADLTNRRTTTLAVENIIKESSMESEAENFLLLFCSLLADIVIENELCERVFGTQKDSTSLRLMRDMIVRPTVFVFGHGDVFLSQVQKKLAKQDHASMLCLFPIAKFLRTNERRFDTLNKLCSGDLKRKFAELPKSVDALCVKGLEDFIEHVKSDEDKFVPKDGTVHQLTSNALIFLEQLMQWRDCLTLVLSGGQLDQSQGLVPKIFARILSALGLNLRNKAELYSTSSNFAVDFVLPLKSLFMLNNYNHILKSLQKTGIMKIVCQQNREVENYYYDQIKDYRRQYLSSWTSLPVVFLEYQKKTGMVDGPVSLMQNAKLKDKEREQIKTTFSDFNQGFEVALQAHMTLSLPDSDVAGQLRKEVKDLILPKYSWFYNNHHTANFTKNPEKYVRYTPQDIIASLDKLFVR